MTSLGHGRLAIVNWGCATCGRRGIVAVIVEDPIFPLERARRAHAAMQPEAGIDEGRCTYPVIKLEPRPTEEDDEP